MITVYTGQIIPKMYDPAKKELVWWDAVTKRTGPEGNSEKGQKNIEKIIAKLLKNYPAKQNKSEPSNN